MQRKPMHIRRPFFASARPPPSNAVRVHQHPTIGDRALRPPVTRVREDNGVGYHGVVSASVRVDLSIYPQDEAWAVEGRTHVAHRLCLRLLW